MYLRAPGNAPELKIGSTRSWLVGAAAAVGGAYSVMHQIQPPGLVSPAHRHTHEDQVAIVLAGRLGFWVEGSDEVEATAGAFVVRPRGLFHALWNTWDEPATMLDITSPGEPFEHWMHELNDLVVNDEADQSRVRAIAADTYGIQFAGPDDPDGSRKHGVTASSAFWKKST